MYSRTERKAIRALLGSLDKVCEVEFEKHIGHSYEALATYVRAYDQKMFMKRENIADRGIWTAKKRYILNVWDSKGVRYKEPKLKMMGIKQSSLLHLPCRQKIKDALKVIMSGSEEETQQFIAAFQKFQDSIPDQIAFPRSCNNLTKFKDNTTLYRKGTPIHARGAILYNYHIKRTNLIVSIL